jgi:[protein-PII] uridylyltransferase
MGLSRGSLLADESLSGRSWSRAHSDLVDRWLSELFEDAAGAETSGLSLVAIGGYGRSELCPRSDIDVMLLHDRRVDVGAIAERLWYPVWEQELLRGHSVTTVRDASFPAPPISIRRPPSLSARLVAGDPAPVVRWPMERSTGGGGRGSSCHSSLSA